jgi:hypothetical protein
MDISHRMKLSGFGLKKDPLPRRLRKTLGYLKVRVVSCCMYRIRLDSILLGG